MEALNFNQLTEENYSRYFFEPIAKASLIVLAGVIAALFQSTLAFALLSIGIAMLSGIAAIKIYAAYYEEAAIDFCLKVIAFDSSLPWLQASMLLVTLALSALFPQASLLPGVCLGCYQGALLPAKQCQRLQAMQQAPRSL